MPGLLNHVRITNRPRYLMRAPFQTNMVTVVALVTWHVADGDVLQAVLVVAWISGAAASSAADPVDVVAGGLARLPVVVEEGANLVRPGLLNVRIADRPYLLRPFQTNVVTVVALVTWHFAEWVVLQAVFVVVAGGISWVAASSSAANSVAVAGGLSQLPVVENVDWLSRGKRCCTGY